MSSFYNTTTLKPSNVLACFYLFFNSSYLLLIFYILLATSGTLFEVNSNFLLFFVFTLFLFVCNIAFSYTFLNTKKNIILTDLNSLINYHITALYFFKYITLNNRLILFKNIFIYIRSFNIYIFFFTRPLVSAKLGIRSFLLSKAEDFTY